MSPFLIAYFTLSTATIIKGHVIRDHKQIEHMPVPKGFQYEPGIDANHMLIFGCDRYSEVLNMNCTIIIRLTDGTKNQCNFNVTKTEAESYVRVERSSQLTTNRTILQWLERHSEDDLAVHHFEVIDTDSCDILKSKLYSYDREKSDDIKKFTYTNIYDDGFDVVFYGEPDCPENRTCYDSFDLNGNEIGEHRILPIETNITYIQPVSRKSREKGFYAFHFHRYTVLGMSVITNTRAKVVMNMNVKNSRMSFVDDHSTVICGVLPDDDGHFIYQETIECTQFGVTKNEIFKANFTNNVIRIFDVRGLRSGGILVFKYGYRHGVVVIEIRPNQRMIEHKFEIDEPSDNHKVVSFDEEGGSFLLAYIQQVEDDLRFLVMYELMIPSKFQTIKLPGGDSEMVETNFNRVDGA